MFDKAVILKDVVELPSKTVSVALGRAAVTSRVAVTVGTKMGDFSETADLLSKKPLRRPQTRKPERT
jgi:hypothetical protein